MAVFVDTGAWYALSVPSDADHAAASTFMRSNRERLIISDYIYDELLNAISFARAYRSGERLGEPGRAGGCEIIRVTDADLLNATDVFFDYRDKAWSFTDCTSRVVMERLDIRRAFAFDDHFRQFGTVGVVP